MTAGKRKSDSTTSRETTKKILRKRGADDDYDDDIPLPKTDGLDIKCINMIRCLGAEMPFAANSGHPGAPMGCAPISHVLWGYQMNYTASNPKWWNRDRFVLSNGHSCALLYAMLHLSGYDVSKDDMKKFRQVNSKTPGHPENYVTEGVEVSTGPLGQGFANAVGMAMASHHFAARFNKKGFEVLFDNFVYVICGDGCLQEGVTSEASSLAGHLKLGKLIVLYDDNGITIDGSTYLSFTEDVLVRYKSYGWHTIEVPKADTDWSKIQDAVVAAKNVTDRPSLIKIGTTIGFGSLNQGTELVHGAPLKAEDLKQVKEKFGLADSESFSVTEDVHMFYKQRAEDCDKKYHKWNELFAKFSLQYPDEASELNRRFSGRLPKNWKEALPQYGPESKPAATRNLSGEALNAIYKIMPELIGGSADLEGSNKSGLKGEGNFAFGEYNNRYIRYGVREHAMAAINNGLWAYGGLLPFGATFLNFITYAWGAVRLSALSRFGVLYIATHDSIELGEDGPTHQPIEVLPLLRATPNILAIRPADGNETSGAYVVWLQNRSRPTVLALSRDALPHLCGSSLEGVAKGAYILSDFDHEDASNTKKKAVLAGSGSDLQLTIKAKEILLSKGVNVRIVSMPCWDLFEEQTDEYKQSVLPCPRKSRTTVNVYVEAAASLGWDRYFDDWVGMTTFGLSGAAKQVRSIFGFVPECIANKALKLLGESQVDEPHKKTAAIAH